ncbi:MAG: alginate O-acetyltransferase complex protein AlgI, partial [Acidobacteriaceae bacterium]|nr:alginate O-acetyltransferase complex protein AlgI [Acidobacteriaceae bacterium]
ALPIYWLTWNGTARRLILLSCCIIFHTHFAGPAGVIPIVALGTITYFAGLVRWKSVILLAIALNASALIFYKYTLFLSDGLIGAINPEVADQVSHFARNQLLPGSPPLAISFFVFEFVHYLVDVRHGERTIKHPKF